MYAIRSYYDISYLQVVVIFKEKTQMLPKLKIVLACPRGFCAGVTRAIKIVETALEKYGKPVYVRHEIVHNEFVVKSLEDKGAIFVDVV